MAHEHQVFVSFKSEDRIAAARVRNALVTANYTVWWQEDIQCGREWHPAIDAALSRAACVVVLWSEVSVRSQWVCHEASQAIAMGKYVPARIDKAIVPSPYDAIQVADLASWDGQPSHIGLRQLRSRIDQLVSAPTVGQALLRSSMVRRAIAAATFLLLGIGILQLTTYLSSTLGVRAWPLDGPGLPLSYAIAGALFGSVQVRSWLLLLLAVATCVTYAQLAAFPPGLGVVDFLTHPQAFAPALVVGLSRSHEYALLFGVLSLAVQVLGGVHTAIAVSAATITGYSLSPFAGTLFLSGVAVLWLAYFWIDRLRTRRLRGIKVVDSMRSIVTRTVKLRKYRLLLGSPLISASLIILAHQQHSDRLHGTLIGITAAIGYVVLVLWSERYPAREMTPNPSFKRTPGGAA